MVILAARNVLHVPDVERICPAYDADVCLVKGARAPVLVSGLVFSLYRRLRTRDYNGWCNRDSSRIFRVCFCCCALVCIPATGVNGGLRETAGARGGD